MEFVKPCLASPVDRPPSGEQWLHEIKFDGYRLQAHVEGARVTFFTRSGLDWSGKFRSLTALFKDLGVKDAIIDGEAVVLDERGVSSFSSLVDDLKRRRSNAIVFMAFDLLRLDGKSLSAKPLAGRKEQLRCLLERLPPENGLRLSTHMQGDGADVLRAACKLGLEGIVSKRSDLPYRSGRREDWLKSKCVLEDEFIVVGCTESKGMKEAVGALLLAYYDGRALTYAGRVGSGFTEEIARELWAKCHKLAADPAIPQPADARRGVVWVKPRLVAQVAYRDVTRDRILRHATFKGLREDKPAREVGVPHRFRRDGA